MTKSVKELIYDYLNNGNEAYIACKMRYFNTVQTMFSDIAADVYRSRPIRDKHDQFATTFTALAERNVIVEAGGNIHQMKGRMRAIEHTTHGAVTPYIRDYPSDGHIYAQAASRKMLSYMWAMHSKANGLDYGIEMLPRVSDDFDSCHISTQENPMKYIVKLLTTELYHNEVVLVSELINKLNTPTTAIFSDGFVIGYEELLESMAALGQASVTLENHDFVKCLIERNLDTAHTKVRLTAPTEDNPSVIAAFYVTGERLYSSALSITVSITPVTEATKNDMVGLVEMLRNYNDIVRDIAQAYLVGHIKPKASKVLNNLEIEPYSPKDNSRNATTTLTRTDILLTARTNVEHLLANPGQFREYTTAMRDSGIRIDTVDNKPSGAFWSQNACGNGAWMIAPVVVEPGVDEPAYTVFAAEDDLINYHAPRRFREADVVQARKNAVSFANHYFGTESAE